MPSKKILVIVGPTASGKTRMAVELAKAHNGEVVSADSMQIYRRMDIGTAKPTAEEMDGVPHHMIDVADPEEDFSVARYVELASACVDDILARGKLPIVAGGTGLYVDSLLSGRTFAAFSPESALRKELEEELRKAENEAERIKEAEARLSKRVSELEKSLEDQRRERREICGAAANVHLYAQLGGEKAASRELKGILQVIAKESRKIAERMDA